MSRSLRLSFVGTWVSQWILWLIFTNSVGVRELVAGAVGSGISTALLYRYFSRTTNEDFRIPLRYVAYAVHIPTMLARDTWVLLQSIGRRLAGKELPSRIVAIPFHRGGSDALSQGRRAFAITILTLTPNTLVLDIPQDREILFFHTLIPQPIPKFIREIAADTEHTA